MHRPVVLRCTIPGIAGGTRAGVRPISAKPHGRPYPDQSLELRLYLVSAAFSGNSRYLGSHAVKPAGHSRVCAADLAARPPVEILCQFDPVAYGSLASPHRHRRHYRGEPRLSRHVRDRVRLFAMDLELGGLHVPDPACGKNLARLKGRAADLNERSRDHIFRLDRYPDPARRDRAALLSGLQFRSPDAHVERALAAMADMRFLKADHQRAKLRQTEPLRHLAAQHPALGISSRAAFAGDDKHERQAVAAGALQETEQFAMGSGLRHAVQVEPGIDLLPPA